MLRKWLFSDCILADSFRRTRERQTHAQGPWGRLGVVCILRGGPWGVVSLLLSLPQIASPTGFLQPIPPSNHLRTSYQHPCPSLNPARANMLVPAVQKQSLEVYLGIANGMKKALGLDLHLAIREHLRICS